MGIVVPLPVQRVRSHVDDPHGDSQGLRDGLNPAQLWLPLMRVVWPAVAAKADENPIDGNSIYKRSADGNSVDLPPRRRVDLPAGGHGVVFTLSSSRLRSILVHGVQP